MSKPFYKRIGFLITAGIVLILAIGITVVAFRINHIVEDSLRAALKKNPNRLYQIDFRKIRVSVLSGNVALVDIHIHPRPEVVDSLNEAGIHQALLAHLEVKKLHFKGIDLERLVANTEIILESVEIKKPDITLYLTGEKTAKEKKVDPQKAINDIARRIHDISVNSIALNEADVRVIHLAKDSVLMAEVNDLSIHLTDFKLDTSNAKVPIDLSEASVDMKEVKLNLVPTHDIVIQDLHGSFIDSTLSMASFAFTPKDDRLTFTKKLKYQKAWLAINTKDLNFTGIDIDDFIFKKKLMIRKIEINELDLQAYKDKTPPWPGHLRHEIPSKILMNLPLDIRVEELDILSSSIHFEQKTPDHKELGKLTISDINLTGKNITNMDEYLKDNQIASIQGKMKLMDKGAVNVNLSFDMASKGSHWSLYANVGKMDFAALNPIIFPLTNVKIEQGKLLQADIKMNCSKYVAKGSIDLEYEDAKIYIMRENKETNKLEGLNFLSFVANAVVRTENIAKTAEYKSGKIDYRRSPDQPFIKFLWSGIQSGMIDTFIGLRTKEEKEKQKVFGKKRNRKRKR